MNNDFISIKESEPILFSLCDLLINTKNKKYEGFRYIKYDNGKVVWYNENCSIPSHAITHWKYNKNNNTSEEAIMNWLNNLPQVPDEELVGCEDIVSI